MAQIISGIRHEIGLDDALVGLEPAAPCHHAGVRLLKDSSLTPMEKLANGLLYFEAMAATTLESIPAQEHADVDIAQQMLLDDTMEQPVELLGQVLLGAGHLGQEAEIPVLTLLNARVLERQTMTRS
jgi:hypothetical protein